MTSIYWQATDGASWDGPAKIVHTVEGDNRGPDTSAKSLCGVSGSWYDEYDHRDGGAECQTCNEAHRKMQRKT